jgi:hypothetical protein
MIKVGITILMIATLMTSFAFPAIASPKTDLMDSKDIIEKLNSITGDDSSKLKSIVDLFFQIKEQSYKSLKAIDFSPFFASEQLNTDMKYYSDKQEVRKAVIKHDNIIANSQRIAINIDSIVITGSTASVIVYEEYEFMYNDGLNIQSGMGDIYTIDFYKESGDKWRIIKVRSTDEFDEFYYDKGFDVTAIIEEINTPYIVSIQPSNENDNDNFVVTATPITVPYNAAKAAQYAMQYTEKSTTYNNLFHSWIPSGVDCQNFASQCVWYGLGGQNLLL